MSSSSTPDGQLPSWLLFERFVFRRDDDKDGPFPDNAAAPMRASSFTSLGDPFTVAVLPAAPPAVSRVYVQWPRGARSRGVSCGTELLTADKGLLLLRLTSEVKLGPNETDKYPYKQDYFVCNCRSTSSSPSMSIRRLPECTEPIVYLMGNINTSVDRRFHADAVGLCRLGEEFAVVQLAKFFVGEKGKMGAELCMLRSAVWTDDDYNNSNIVAEGKWELMTPPIDHLDEEFNDLRCWSTDGTMTFGDSLVWVDYHQGGMMSYRLRPEPGEANNFISYHRLPIDARPRNSLPSRYPHEKYRRLCVTGEKSGGAHLQFVEVVRTDGAYFGPISPGSSFTINSHTFTPADDGQMWRKDAVFPSRQLQYLNSRNPFMDSYAVTMFPVVSRADPNVVHFLMSEKQRVGIDKLSVVVIDVVAGTIVSVFPYIVGDEDLCGEHADMVRQRRRLPRSFLPTGF